MNLNIYLIYILRYMNKPFETFDKFVKMCVVGDSGNGKTSLINKCQHY